MRPRDAGDMSFRRNGAVGVALLDRPEALNALSLPMIRALAEQLDRWTRDPDVAAVVLRGVGDRAFCSGGDIRSVCEAGPSSSLARSFFREEYRLNRQIHGFPKPYIALIHGITMGGGLGLSLHGSHPVATEGTVAAMPETGIGFFPDVGASHFLGRLPNHIGVYLGLSGSRIGAADLSALNLVTHVVPGHRLDELEEALGREVPVGAPDPHASVEQVLADFAVTPGPSGLRGRAVEIDRAFAAASVEEILWRLDGLGTPWAREVADELRGRSPTSLKVALRQLTEGALLDIDEALRVEYRLSCRFVEAHDFCEGVRAALVDRDHDPRWDPPSVEAVSDEHVERFFAPLPPTAELDFPPFP